MGWNRGDFEPGTTRKGVAERMDVQKTSVEAIFKSLNDSSVRYLVAGGLAVVAHGHLRFTANLDLILDLDEGNARRALSALAGLGYRPQAPVSLDEFANPHARAKWVSEKGLTVFSLHSPEHPTTEIDLFVEPPLDFEKAYGSAVRFDVAPGIPVTFVAFDDLVKLKKKAGRPQDIADLDRLQAIREANQQ